MSPKLVFCLVNSDTRQLLFKAQAATDEGEVAVHKVTSIESVPSYIARSFVMASKQIKLVGSLGLKGGKRS